MYRCPGEAHPISRSVHLGRLSSFYPGCQHCAFRDETATLSRRQVQWIAESRSHAEVRQLYVDEGIAGVASNDLRPPQARDVAAAFGTWLLTDARAASRDAVAFVAGDGRNISAEFVAAVGEGLRWAGCPIIEIGDVTTGVMAFAISQRPASGGILVGNPLGKPHTTGCKLWGPNGKPLVRGGELDAVQVIHARGVDRPARRLAAQSRRTIDEAYLAQLAPRFHALRPLRFVVHSLSAPWLRLTERLLAPVACQMIPISSEPAEAIPKRPRSRDATSGTAHSSPWSTRLAAAVRQEAAHFGLLIDSHGEALQLIDEQGRLVSAEGTFALISSGVSTEEQQLHVALVEENQTKLKAWLERPHVHIETAPSNSAALFDRMRDTNCRCGLDHLGRAWFAAPLPCPDALWSLAWLLTVLSRDDRPLSQVIAEGLAVLGTI